MADTYKILHSPFDIETHKANFINYLELVILEDGTIEYAVPSHQRKLEQLVSAECPVDMYGNYLEWLMEQSGAVCVWYDGYIGKPNARQKQSIIKLVRAGLMNFDKVVE